MARLPSDPPETFPRGSHPRAVFGLSVLTFVNLLNYLDRYIVAGALPKIQEAPRLPTGPSEGWLRFLPFQDHGGLGIGHEQAGYLATVFVVVYMLFSPLGGFLGDRIPRRFLVAGSVFLWSFATVGSGLATNFASLLIARALVGIGEAGYGTVAPALISDLFPRNRRTRMLSVFYVALPVGSAFGFALGGWLSEHFGWNSAFLVGGAPGLALAGLALWMPEPAPGATEAVASPAKVPFHLGLRALSTNALFWTNTAAITLMTFSIGGLAFWMPAFLAQERGVSVDRAGVILGAITVIGGTLGTLAGGALGDWAERKRAGGGMWISGLGLLVAAPGMVVGATAQSTEAIFAAILLAQFFLFLNTGPINAAICNCVPATFRAFAMGLNILLIHLLGDAVSPPIIGAIADRASLSAAIVFNAAPVAVGGLVLIWAARRFAPSLPDPARPAPQSAAS